MWHTIVRDIVAPSARASASRRAQDLLLARRDLCHPDLADDPDADAGVANALRDLADQLVGDVLDRALVQLGRVSLMDVVARSHDHIETGRVRDRLERKRISPEPDRRHVDDGPAAGRSEEGRLL